MRCAGSSLAPCQRTNLAQSKPVWLIRLDSAARHQPETYPHFKQRHRHQRAGRPQRVDGTQLPVAQRGTHHQMLGRAVVKADAKARAMADAEAARKAGEARAAAAKEKADALAAADSG